MRNKVGIAAIFVLATIQIAWLSGAFSSETTFAQRDATTQWDYAIVSAPYFPFTGENTDAIVTSAVSICYLQQAGCRSEQEKGEVIVARFLQETRFDGQQDTSKLIQNRAAENAIARALTRLGSEGFELVESGKIRLDRYVNTSRGGNRVIAGEYEATENWILKRPRR